MTTEEIYWPLRTIVATFSPKRTDDLRPDLAPPIGYRGEWRFCWEIDHDSPYLGQWCLMPTDHNVRSGWVPISDLADIVGDVPNETASSVPNGSAVPPQGEPSQ